VFDHSVEQWNSADAGRSRIRSAADDLRADQGNRFALYTEHDARRYAKCPLESHGGPPIRWHARTKAMESRVQYQCSEFSLQRIEGGVRCSACRRRVAVIG